MCFASSQELRVTNYCLPASQLNPLFPLNPFQTFCDRVCRKQPVSLGQPGAFLSSWYGFHGWFGVTYHTIDCSRATLLFLNEVFLCLFASLSCTCEFPRHMSVITNGSHRRLIIKQGLDYRCGGCVREVDFQSVSISSCVWFNVISGKR